MNPNSKFETNNFTEHLFREFYQEVFSSLVIKFGSKHVDLIEDAIQETFFKALKSWKYNAYPEKPKGWLFTVTKNYILNHLKKDKINSSLSEYNLVVENDADPNYEDAQLQMVLACSQLEIKEQSKLIFTLKHICGFGITEIANSLLLTEANVYKNLQRAKQKLQLVPKKHFEVEGKRSFSEGDIRYIETIIYCMFNEGYDSVNTNINEAIHKEICFEAVRLAHLLEKHSKAESTQHILALCYFHMARFSSRIDTYGEFVSLRNQDRSQWDEKLVKIGFKYLVKPSILNRYYIEALIASFHLKATRFSSTNWKEILKLYDLLLEIDETPIIRLNRAICMFELHMNDIALKELESIKPLLEDNYLYFSVSMAEYLEDKDVELSKFWYQKSLEKTKQDFRRKIILTKLEQLL